jgi:hypothetical protein
LKAAPMMANNPSVAVAMGRAVSDGDNYADESGED